LKVLFFFNYDFYFQSFLFHFVLFLVLQDNNNL